MVLGSSKQVAGSDAMEEEADVERLPSELLDLVFSRSLEDISNENL